MGGDVLLKVRQNWGVGAEMYLRFVLGVENDLNAAANRGNILFDQLTENDFWSVSIGRLAEAKG